MTKHNTSSFQEMVTNLKGRHIQTLRELRSMGIATHKLTRGQCGVACVYARGLKMDDARRAEFYTEAYPDGFKRFHPDKLLLHVLMYFYGVTGSHDVGYGTASAHAVALYEIYNNHDLSDDDVMRQIESNGIFADLRDDIFDEGEEAPLGREGKSHSPRRPVKPASIFADQEDDEPVTEVDKAEQEDDDPQETDNVFRAPIRKPPAPAVQLPRLQWAYVELCVLARPKGPEDREAILGPLRDGKNVWVKLKPGKNLEYELHRGDGSFIDTTVEEYRVEDE